MYFSLSSTLALMLDSVLTSALTVLARMVVSVALIIGLNLLPAFPTLAASITTIEFPIARLDQHQEAPNQILYKAFATLHDQNGHVWRAIAFNHVLPDGSHNFKLRLVGFPGSSAVDRTQSLHIKTALGQSFTTPDDSEHIAIDEGMDAIDVPPNVAQYDLAAIAPHLYGLVPLRLTLPLEDGDIRLLILPNTIQEWKSVAAH